MKVTFSALATLFLFSSLAFANAVAVRTRSDYGIAGSLILATGTQTTDGVTVNSQEFCSDAITNPDIGTCELAFAFQIASTLPSNGQSLTLTLPVPTGATGVDAGLLTNDNPITGGNIFFSPFSQSAVVALSDSAILFGTDGSGNPFFTFALPVTLTGGGTGLSIFMNVSDRNAINNDGLYCYKLADPGVSGCMAIDTPGIPTLGVDLQTSTVGAPEPGSLALLASGLLGLGVLRRKRKMS